MKRLGGFMVLFLKDERGGILVLVAVLIVVLLGVTALAVDAGDLYQNRRMVVNAADAAALAGAQELAKGGSNNEIENQATTYAGLNGALIGDITITSNTVKVDTYNEVELAFARFLGFEKMPVSATATAYVGPFEEWEGLIPIALKESAITEGGIVVIDFHTLGAGNWGVLSFSGPGSGYNPNTVAGYIRNGYPYPVKVYCEVTSTAPGKHVAGAQGEVNNALIDIVGSEVYVPIISNEYEPGSKPVEIIGFARVLVDMYDEDNTILVVRLIEQLDVAELNPDQSAQDFGLVGVALIE